MGLRPHLSRGFLRNPEPLTPPPYPAELDHGTPIGGRADLSSHRVPAEKIEPFDTAIDFPPPISEPYATEQAQVDSWSEALGSQQQPNVDPYWPY